MAAKQRNDRHDIDPREARLISVGHFLWRLHKKNRQEPGIENVLEAVWDRKRQVRLELEVERTTKREATRLNIAGRKPDCEPVVLYAN